MLEIKSLEVVLKALESGVEFERDTIENIITKTRAQIDTFDQEFCGDNKHYCSTMAKVYVLAIAHSINYK